MTAADIVDTHALAQLVWVSLGAGLVLVGSISLAIIGFARAGHERREGRATAAGAFAALALLGTVVVAAGVVAGVAIMLHKG